MRLRVLDLFCGAGGASKGYHDGFTAAGFDVDIVGVDIEPQPNYPYTFVQADAMTYPLDGFDFIHASPPCQAHVQWNNLNRERYGSVPEHVDLIAATRGRLVASGAPYAIENVVGAPLHNTVLLCGSMFGLGVRRHRLFETPAFIMRTQCRHTRREIAVYGKLDGRRVWTRTDGSEVRAARRIEQASAAMGIDWMTWNELKESIPPAYTAFLAEQIAPALVRSAA